jgi:hypothetical protein
MSSKRARVERDSEHGDSKVTKTVTLHDRLPATLLRRTFVLLDSWALNQLVHVSKASRSILTHQLFADALHKYGYWPTMQYGLSNFASHVAAIAGVRKYHKAANVIDVQRARAELGIAVHLPHNATVPDAARAFVHTITVPDASGTLITSAWLDQFPRLRAVVLQTSINTGLVPDLRALAASTTLRRLRSLDRNRAWAECSVSTSAALKTCLSGVEEFSVLLRDFIRGAPMPHEGLAVLRVIADATLPDDPHAPRPLRRLARREDALGAAVPLAKTVESRGTRRVS